MISVKKMLSGTLWFYTGAWMLYNIMIGMNTVNWILTTTYVILALSYFIASFVEDNNKLR